MPASPQPVSTVQAVQTICDVDLLCSKMASSDCVPLNPAVNGLNIPCVNGEPDYSEHIVRSAWFQGVDGQRSEREIVMGRPALRRDIPGADSIELSYPSVLAGQVSLMQRLVRWQKHF